MPELKAPTPKAGNLMLIGAQVWVGRRSLVVDDIGLDEFFKIGGDGRGDAGERAGVDADVEGWAEWKQTKPVAQQRRSKSAHETVRTQHRRVDEQRVSADELRRIRVREIVGTAETQIFVVVQVGSCPPLFTRRVRR